MGPVSIGVEVQRNADGDTPSTKVHGTLIVKCVCGTVSSIMSGLETRSLGLNTLGTT